MKSSRHVYLKMKTLQEAREILFETFSEIQEHQLFTETLSVPDAVGRVLALPVTAKLSSPNFHAAAMDGIAVKAKNTFGANEGNPKELIIGKEASYVNTGHVLPEGTDAVIMIEHVNVTNENCVEIEAPAFPWQHVRKIGEDIVATELLFPRNHVITPYCVGALLSGGVLSVSVRKKPKVFILPTGSELVSLVPRLESGSDNSLAEELTPGKALETNSFVLGKLAESCGGTYVRHEIVSDDEAAISQVIQDAVSSDADIILTVGGSSAGSEDYTKDVVAALGEVLVHGVTIMPGKPVVIGRIKEKPVFGIPGYPVSAIIAFEQFVGPLIFKMLHQPVPERDRVLAEPVRKIASKLGVEEFLRVKMGIVGDRVVATSLPRGAGCITSITEADGIIRVPNHIEGIKDNKPTTAELLRPASALRNTIVVVGSHDNTLDVLTDQLKEFHSHLTLSSSHVGSMGGLMAIKRNVCHLAGSHLLDTRDSSYNISYIRRYLPDIPVKVVQLVFRDQGLIIPPGNPKSIRGIEDLSRDDIMFINRQGGSGTRILLDYRLSQSDMSPDVINGYDNEEFTHMAVAVAVLSGAADAGLGIYAAAKALELDFIPVVTEQYDLIIPEQYFETENIRMLLDTINTGEFKKRVEALGGYDTKKTGEIIM